MSVYMNVFAKTDAAVRDFALDFSRILGKPFTLIQTEVGAVYETDVLGIRVVVLGQPGLADDGEDNLNFTRYQVQIDIGPMTGGQAHDALVRAMATHLAHEIGARLKCPTMVTEGLRKLTGTFAVDG
jgi:hypothetical protein